VRDLAYPLGNWGYSGFVMDVTPNGSVWLSSRLGSSGLFRLGEEPVFEDPAANPPYREVAPDGSLWGLGGVSGGLEGLFSFDGEGWTVRATTTDGGLTALAVGSDGTVWVAAIDRDKYCPDIEDGDCSGIALLRLEDDGSLRTIEDWSDVYDHDASAVQLAVSSDGDVWLVGRPRGYIQRAEVLLRFDGEGWEAIPGPERWNPGDMGRYLEFGPDGALWVRANAAGGLDSFDDPGWTTFTEADGLQSWYVQGNSETDVLEVAADGSLWLLGSPNEAGRGCGVTRYDGTTWTSYLVESESCVDEFTLAPDGSVWLRAAEGGWLHTYVITPEAVAATE
jgi:hypothetical protein